MFLRFHLIIEHKLRAKHETFKKWLKTQFPQREADKLGCDQP